MAVSNKRNSISPSKRNKTCTMSNLETVRHSSSGIDSLRQLPNDRWAGITICLHPDYRRVGEVAFLFNLLKPDGSAHLISRDKPFFSKPGEKNVLPTSLDTPFVSARSPISVSLEQSGSIRLSCDNVKNIRIDGRPMKNYEVVDCEHFLKTGIVLSFSTGAVLLLHAIDNTDELFSSSESDMKILGFSNGIRKLRADIRRVSKIDDTVLILGEVGSGKELTAKALHKYSVRNDKKYHSYNINNFTDTTEALLFGFVGGIFADAPKGREGAFVIADKGTLFLDEIGEAPVHVQSKLLRAIAEKEIWPRGAHSPTQVDVRLLFATDKNLETKVTEGSMSLAFYSRLQRLTITVPPLRERRDDICRLFFKFLQTELQKANLLKKLEAGKITGLPWCTSVLIELLLNCYWPGNVRELESAVAQIIADNLDNAGNIMVNNSLLDKLQNISTALTPNPPVELSNIKPQTPLKRRILSDIDEGKFLAAYNSNLVFDGKCKRGNRRAIAKALGICPNSAEKLIVEVFKKEKKKNGSE